MHFKKQSSRNLRRLQRKAARFHARIHIRTGLYHLILPGYCTLSFRSFTALWIFIDRNLFKLKSCRKT